MRRETDRAGGEARERPVCPARSADLPWAVLGTGDGAVRPHPRACVCGAAGPAAVLAAHGQMRRGPRARWPGRLAPAAARRGSAGCLPPRRVRGGRMEVIVAWRRARRSGRVCRRHQAPPGDAGQVPRCPGLAPCRIRRWCAHPVPVDAATGPGRDAIHGPAPEDRPAPPPGPPGAGVIPAQPSPAPSPPWPGSGGLPRASPELPTWPGGTAAGGLPVPPAGSR
jgi:hypothetical protein